MGSLRRSKLVKWLVLVGGLSFFIFSVSSCKPKVRNRPYGYIRLGPIADFSAAETNLDKDWLLIRRDDRGFSAMSTLCSRDLYPLKLDKDGKFICDSCRSVFIKNGDLVSGSAVRGLPYYKLKLDSKVLNQPRDYLYVLIGEEVERDWRMERSL